MLVSVQLTCFCCLTPATEFRLTGISEGKKIEELNSKLGGMGENYQTCGWLVGPRSTNVR